MINQAFKINIVFILVFAICSNCVNSRIKSVKEAHIIDVYSQKYKGGIKGTPSGIRYKLFVIAPANHQEFKTIGFWINDSFAWAKAYKNEIGTGKTVFNKGDTLIVAANFVLTPKGYVFQDSTTTAQLRPKTLNSKVILQYTVNDVNKYAEFNEIKVLEEELRP